MLMELTLKLLWPWSWSLHKEAQWLLRTSHPIGAFAKAPDLEELLLDVAVVILQAVL